MHECDRHQRAKLSRRQLLGGIFLLALAGACATDRPGKGRKDEEKAVVTESATKYWQALMWNNGEKAVEYIEKDEDKSHLWEYLISRDGKARLSDTQVYMVILDERYEHATVSVSYQVALAESSSVETRQAKQTWYRHGGKWYLELTGEELKRLN
jgi:hypothetical protein